MTDIGQRRKTESLEVNFTFMFNSFQQGCQGNTIGRVLSVNCKDEKNV